ncbi:hypothetical protein AU381_19490 [Sinorhizobium glycinis]|uniref:Uncharacterized protein n=1 Tax=Sinorhizobium glycinis TaxID=1472378 RepID=A0A178XP52_9HYPH|nr:hypothetical protein AU381_19490 [Sinorhizobium glycinis]
MLIYGDPTRSVRADILCETIAARLRALEVRPPGLERHAALVGIFIKAGELVQGLSDFELETVGADELSARREKSGVLLLDLARLVAESWSRGFSGRLAPPDRVWPLLQELRAPLPLSIKEGEGYAFYALYPESYIEAARRSGLGANTVVIGIRSIGASLSAAVAAAIGAGAPVTVRPVGHPFRRKIHVGPQLSQRLLKDRTADFAIVDEGPGLSGSSFGGVADWLEANGVSESRIHFFPGHSGDLGPEASQDHRKRWAARPRQVVELDELVVAAGPSPRSLAAWVSELVGPLSRPLQEISGGGWRSMLPRSHESWPPADPRFERRKFLAHTADGPWLVKFAGIGDVGQRKLEKARLLAEAGFTPPVAGLCHGFLVQKWVAATQPGRSDVHRADFREHLGRYLAFRARRLPPPATHGASMATLCEMAITNTGEALGESVAAQLRPLLSKALQHDFPIMPVDTDNRLHRWEWLAGERGFLKADALDHCAAHDLVGSQDVAWDVAGAVVEFDLTPEEGAALQGIVSDGSSRAVDAELQEIFELCYLAFQLGLWTSAKTGAGSDEVPRLDAVAARYANLLLRRIEGYAGSMCR